MGSTISVKAHISPVWINAKFHKFLGHNPDQLKIIYAYRIFSPVQLMNHLGNDRDKKGSESKNMIVDLINIITFCVSFFL